MKVQFYRADGLSGPGVMIVQPGYYAIGIGLDRSKPSRWLGWGPLATWVDRHHGFRMKLRTWWFVRRVAVSVTWNTWDKAQVDEVGRWKRMEQARRRGSKGEE